MSEKLSKPMTINFAEGDITGLNKIITNFLGYEIDESKLVRVLTRATASRILEGKDSILELFKKHYNCSIKEQSNTKHFPNCPRFGCDCGDIASHICTCTVHRFAQGGAA